MTRFLSRIWKEPFSGNLNQETERLFSYHQATKHTYQSVRLNAHYLDWKNQPNPFRIYEGAPITVLPPDPGSTGRFAGIGTFAAIGALAEGAFKAAGENGQREEVNLDLLWLSRFLWHSMAISAWKKVPGSEIRYSLRVNPSSGNLHPTETYLALHGFADIEDGLYHYRSDTHALELRSPGAATSQLAHALRIPAGEQPKLIVGLTSTFWREAWKYRDRAYRYCCHDMGHAMVNLLLAARSLGLAGSAIAHFGDAELTEALGLSGGDEAPMAFLAFPSGELFHQKQPQRADAIVFGNFLGIPNELSPQETPYELLLEIHRASVLPDSPGASPVLQPENAEVASDQPLAAECPCAPAFDAPLAAVVRRRRSALDFDARTSPMERRDLEQLLDFATRDWPADWHGSFRSAKPLNLVTLYLYIHRVRDCDPGVYRWDRATSSLEQLHRGNVERVAAYLSLEQALAGNSCFTISMIANLAKAADIFGNRGYRYVHFEAGAIGQRLYVGAEALNWNATGIGAFYDDDVHRYLGFLDEAGNPVEAAVDAAERQTLVMTGSPASRLALHLEAHDPSPAKSGAVPNLPKDSRYLAEQVIYHFAVGRAVPDPRIQG